MSETTPARYDSAPRTDEELVGLDLRALLTRGLVDADGAPDRRELFGAGAVCAAITLDRLDVRPRSVMFLAETVRAGGTAYAAELPEPVPDPAASRVLKDWLRLAVEVQADGTDVARWLDAVARLVDMRRRVRTAPSAAKQPAVGLRPV